MQEHQRERSTGVVDRLRRAGLSLQEDALRKAILRAFANDGHAPSVQNLAHALRLPLASVLAACRTLARHDLIVWKGHEARIVSAYSFSGLPTTHQVLMESQTTLYAMCAVDALGIPCVLDQGARIRSACFFCHTPVRVDVQDGRIRRTALDPRRLVLGSGRVLCGGGAMPADEFLLQAATVVC